MEIKKDNVVYKISFAGVNEYPVVNPTDGEALIFDYIKSLCPLAEFVRKSSEYVTAAYKETDIARFKFTERARWIVLPYLDNKKKRRFDEIDDLNALKDDIIKSYETAIKINDM